MKKLWLVILLLLCCFGCREKTELELLVEKNGADSAYVYNRMYDYEKKWIFANYGSDLIEFNNYFKFKQVVFIETECAAIEFESEEDVKYALSVMYKLNVNAKYFQKGKFLFSPLSGGYVLAYGLDAVIGDGITSDAYIYDEEQDIKTLLHFAINTKPINGELMLDGYDVVATGAFLYYPDKVKKLVIGEKVKTLSYCALLGFNFETVNIPNNVTEISCGNFQFNEIFKYAVIPATCKIIGSEVFAKGNVFCEVESKPSGWKKDFYTNDAKVYWKNEWEYDENGIPTPIVSENDSAS